MNKLKYHLEMLNDLSDLIENYLHSEAHGPEKDALYTSKQNIQYIVEKLSFYLWKKGEIK